MAALEASGTSDEATAEQVRALMKEWNSIGFVPFKEKDRLYKASDFDVHSNESWKQ